MRHPHISRGPGLFSLILLGALLGLHAAPTPLAGQAVAEAHGTDRYLEAIEASRAAILRVLEEHDVPGASVAVGIGGEIVWAEGFGWADLESRVPVSTLTKFRIGSVSKTMAASGLGVLMERGQVDLDAPVQTYVPGFPEKRWPVTTRQLGGHTAGVRHYQGQEMLSSVSYPTTTAGLAIFQDDPLLFEPGTDYSYSTYGWNLLSAVMEGASGEDFLTFMRDEVFEPLNLRHTVADHADSIVVNRVRFYEKGEDGSLINAPYVDNSYKWAGGGFLANAEDLVRFGQAHMAPGFLSAETLAELQTPQTLRSGESTNYGIGWRTNQRDDATRAIGHSGGSVGGTTLMLLFPDLDMVVAAVVNISGYVNQVFNPVAEAFGAAVAGR
jgi:CubicO group peptidase (beta-lactamase class C family)